MIVMDIVDYISTSEAAELTGYDLSYIGALCKQGKLTGAMRKGGAWLIPRISMLAYGKKRNKTD